MQILLNRGQALFDILHAVRSSESQKSHKNGDRCHCVASLHNSIETDPTKKDEAKQKKQLRRMSRNFH